MTRTSDINVDAMTRRIEVDNRIPLHYYYRISDSLLKQANIYRAENNILDLYIILVRYSSLVCETIPKHRDFNLTHSKERIYYKKKLVGVLDELEVLKPEFQRRVDDLNKRDEPQQLNGPTTSSLGGRSNINWRPSQPMITTTSSSSNPFQVGKQFQNLSISLPLPKQETLSKHSLLGPNGLRGQWQAPSAEIKVQYPSNSGLALIENACVSQVEQHGLGAIKDEDFGRNNNNNNNVMESLLSLDDGRWAMNPQEAADLSLIRQPSPPPVLAQINQQYTQIPPSKVADPRPGPANSFQDGDVNSTAYQHLHIPVKIMDDFLRLAKQNTAKNLETCAVLAGSLKNRVFYITTLIIPKQESTSDSCQTLNEEEIFEVQDKLSLFTLGWIHTHPTQSCFMSSVDLHTHYSYQIMLPEAIAIVMAPTDTSSPHAIFHLSDPSGVSLIRKCQQRGFHPHEEPSDGSPIYEHCSHVYMTPNLKFELLDLR